MKTGVAQGTGPLGVSGSGASRGATVSGAEDFCGRLQLQLASMAATGDGTEVAAGDITSGSAAKMESAIGRARVQDKPAGKSDANAATGRDLTVRSPLQVQMTAPKQPGIPSVAGTEEAGRPEKIARGGPHGFGTRASEGKPSADEAKRSKKAAAPQRASNGQAGMGAALAAAQVPVPFPAPRATASAKVAAVRTAPDRPSRESAGSPVQLFTASPDSALSAAISRFADAKETDMNSKADAAQVRVPVPAPRATAGAQMAAVRTAPDKPSRESAGSPVQLFTASPDSALSAAISRFADAKETDMNSKADAARLHQMANEVQNAADSEVAAGRGRDLGKAEAKETGQNGPLSLVQSWQGTQAGSVDVAVSQAHLQKSAVNVSEQSSAAAGVKAKGKDDFVQAAAAGAVQIPDAAEGQDLVARGGSSAVPFVVPEGAGHDLSQAVLSAKRVFAGQTEREKRVVGGSVAGTGTEISALWRDPGGVREAENVSGGNSRLMVNATPSLGHDPFAALDAGTGAGTPNWIHAGAQRAEAGFQDPSLGWVSVRANVSGGAIHAALVPGSSEAAQALAGHLAGLHSHLAAEHLAVHSVTVAVPQWSAGQQGSQQGSREGSQQGLYSGTGQNSGQSGNAQPQTGKGLSGGGMAERSSAIPASSGPGGSRSDVAGSSGAHISVIA